MTSTQATWRDQLPGLLLFRGPQLALRSTPLLVACLATAISLGTEASARWLLRAAPQQATAPAILVTSREGFERALNEALGQVPPTPQTLDSTVIPTQNQQIVVAAALPGDALAVNLPWGTWEWASLEQGRLMWPVTGIGRWLAVAGAEQATVTTRSVAGIVALVWLITWLVAGTAIARSTAEALRSDSGSSLPVLSQHAIGRLGVVAGAALLPLGAVIGLTITAGTLSLVGWLPLGLGTAATWLLSPVLAVLVLLSGLLLAFLTVAGILFPPAAACENSDSFGCFSRVFNYVTAQPWVTLGLMVLAFLIGEIALAAVDFMARHGLGVLSPVLATLVQDSEAPRAAALMTSFLQNVYATTLLATLASLIYLVLREQIDLVPVHNALPGTESESAATEFPVVGMRAPLETQQRHRHDSGTSQQTGTHAPQTPPVFTPPGGAEPKAEIPRTMPLASDDAPDTEGPASGNA